MVSQIIKKTVTGLLVIAFCLAGIAKITDKLSPKVHHQMKRDFADLAKVNPLKVWFHHDVNSDMYCLVIGYLEVICALVLYSAPRPLKFLGIVILLIIMAMIMQGLYWLGKPAVVFIPGAVSSILLVINFITLLAEAPPKQKKRE
nr:uncharacterized protein LOC131790379 [Pocillopora verrucosa]